MAGTIVVDRIESDSSYTSTINVASKVNFTSGMQIGGQDTTFGGMRNRIINGAMMISQRGTSFSGLTDGNNGAYSLDRWTWSETGTSTGVQTLSQDTTSPPTGFINSLKVLTTTAHAVGSGNGYNISQWIEGLNVADLGWGTASAATVTVSFWVKSSLTGTFAGGLVNAAFDTSYVFNYTISAANTWEKKTVIIPGPTSGTFPTDNGRSFRLIFDLGAGSTYQTATTNAWISANVYSTSGSQSVVGTLNATFNITGVQLEKGSAASAFEYRQYGQELALCHRYFTAFVADGGIDNFAPLAIGRWYEGTSAQFFFTMPTQMRYPPTLDALATTAVGTFAVNTGGGFNAVVITGMSLNERSYSTATVSIGYSTGGQTTGQATTLYCDNTDFARIGFTAEL